MIRTGLLVLVLLLGALPVLAAPRLLPQRAVPGDVVLLTLDAPATAAEVTFGDRTFPLVAGGGRWQALLGLDLDTSPGLQPVQVTWETAAGPQAATLQLVVDPVTRPLERLTLPKPMVQPQEPAVLARIAREYERLQALFATATASRPWQGFARPVPQEVGSIFGLRRILNGEPRSPHSGVDFHSPAGTVVRAPAAGRVVLVAELYYTGRTVVLDHGGGLYSLFAHLQRSSCREQQQLAAGEALGRVGSTGRSTGPHLHWSVRLRGDRVDPLALVRLPVESP